MSMIHRHRHGMPGLNTSSLPDLIFSVLFFFMIVTHVRSDLLKVRYQVPSGTELKKLVRKSTVSHIYIGHIATQTGNLPDDSLVMQVNDKLSTIDELSNYLQQERKHASSADAKNLSAELSADRQTPMGMITDVKQALRRSNILRLNYVGTNLSKESK